MGRRLASDPKSPTSTPGRARKRCAKFRFTVSGWSKDSPDRPRPARQVESIWNSLLDLNGCSAASVHPDALISCAGNRLAHGMNVFTNLSIAKPLRLRVLVLWRGLCELLQSLV